MEIPKTDNRYIFIQVILFVLAILTISFIFSNSMLDQQESSEQSQMVLAFIEFIFKPLVVTITEGFLRNLAHMAEFALLGMELILLLRNIKLPYNIITSLFVCVTVALTDETIQRYTDRYPDVMDVWLDVSGATLGVLAGILLYWIIKTIYMRKTKKN